MIRFLINDTISILNNSELRRKRPTEGTATKTGTVGAACDSLIRNSTVKEEDRTDEPRKNETSGNVANTNFRSSVMSMFARLLRATVHRAPDVKNRK